MARIYYNTLNKELKNKIDKKELSKDDLRKLYKRFIDNINKKKRTINVVMILVICLFFVMTMPVIMKASDPKLTKFMLLIIIPTIIFIYILIYYTQVGLIKTQLENAIKKNYPEMIQELELMKK